MTNASRQAAYRARLRAAGLSEVRGIFASPDQSLAIRAAAGLVRDGVLDFVAHEGNRWVVECLVDGHRMEFCGKSEA